MSLWLRSGLRMPVIRLGLRPAPVPRLEVLGSPEARKAGIGHQVDC